MRPIQSHTLGSVLLVIDCKGVNRDDGLHHQLMTLLLLLRPCDEVVFGKEAFNNLGIIHTRNTDGEVGLKHSGITSQLFPFKVV